MDASKLDGFIDNLIDAAEDVAYASERGTGDEGQKAEERLIRVRQELIEFIKRETVVA